MTWGIWQIYTRALESVKIRTFMDPFAQGRKCVTLKFTEELCVMTMKNDTKIEEELTLIWSEHSNSKKLVFLLAPCDQSI